MVNMRCYDDFKNKEAKIKVIGVGGGGGNAVNRMIEAGIRGVEFIAVNTDAQVLKLSKAPVRIQIGEEATKGLGAGTDPNIGRQAAVESEVQIKEIVSDCDLLFITAGMGGGTGTGAGPVIAKIAKENTNALIVGVVTRPFSFEGGDKRDKAEDGINEMRKHTDSMLIIPNDRLLEIDKGHISNEQAMRMADDVLRQAIQGISDVITSAGTINMDFADVKKVMYKSGDALIGIGKAEGENRHIEAAKKAMESPFLENVVIDNAAGLLVNFTSSKDLLLVEIGEAMDYIKRAASPDAIIKYGQAYDESMGDTLKITVIATGFKPNGIFKQDRALSGYLRKRPSADGELHLRYSLGAKKDLEKPAYLRFKSRILK